MSASGQLSDSAIPESVYEEAVTWQLRVREACATGQSLTTIEAELNHWLQADRIHQQAFNEMQTLWHKLEQPIETALERTPAKAMNAKPLSERSDKVVPLFNKRAAWSSIAAGLLISLTTLYLWQDHSIGRWNSDFQTEVGQEQTVTLSDETAITLNTYSAMKSNFSDTERRVELIQGEAWFDVTKDTDRPFYVTTPDGEIRVTGTEFNVKLDQEGTVISLDEGSIVLASYSQPDAELVTLTPGQQIIASAEGLSTPVKFDRAQVTAWLRNQFVFYQTPLIEVIDELNNHYKGRIIVTNKALHKLHVSGVFSTKNPAQVLDIISNTLPVTVSYMTDYLVLIH